MSAFGDVRDLLEDIHSKMPLTEREKELAIKAVCAGGFEATIHGCVQRVKIDGKSFD